MLRRALPCYLSLLEIILVTSTYKYMARRDHDVYHITKYTLQSFFINEHSLDTVAREYHVV